MQDASLPLEISRLYVDLADRIIARDEEGARRIYDELLRAGRPLEILADAIRVPALRKTLEPALFGEFQYSPCNRDAVALRSVSMMSHRADEVHSAKIPDQPPQQDRALPEVAQQSIIDRAAQRLDWTIVSRTPHETPHGRDEAAHKQPRPGPARIAGLGLGARLCLACAVIAVPAGAGIFLLTRPVVEKAVTDSAPAEEAHAEAREGASSSGGSPPAASVMQTAAPAGPTAASAPTAPELEANLTSGPSLFTAPPGGPAPNTSTAPVVSSPPEATSTVATPPPPTPSVEQRFSAAEIAALLERGNALFRTGDVASARLFYERAADAGEAQGAVRLAETFDPIFLNRAAQRGVRGDVDAALSWYRRARELGATEVSDR